MDDKRSLEWFLLTLITILSGEDAYLVQGRPVRHAHSSVEKNWHYANMPMQYTAIFHSCNNVNFQMKKYNFSQNIDCGYTLEPPH